MTGLTNRLTDGFDRYGLLHTVGTYSHETSRTNLRFEFNWFDNIIYFLTEMVRGHPDFRGPWRTVRLTNVTLFYILEFF